MENIHENSQFTSFNSCAKQDFELCNPPAPFTCSQSGLDLVLLINRFIEMVGGLVQSLFHFPRDLYNSDVQTTAERNKEFFCIRSFEVVTSTIIQYCDCMLNLDLCDMPVQRVLQYVNAKKIEQLKKRAKNKSVNCCRHQMAGTPTCKDGPEMDTFSIEGTYAMMTKRINNVALLLGGRQVLFERLCHALEIPISIASSANTSAANSETFGCLSGSYTCNTRTISFDSNESETGSEDTVVFVGPCAQSFEDQDHASDENSSLVCEDGDNENVDHPNALDSSIQPSDQLDGNNNNNSEENFGMIDVDSQNQQMNSVSGFTKRFRRSLTMQEGGNRTQERPRPRSSTEGDKVFEPESIMMLGITPLLERCAESTETCVRTLCSVLGWRVTREVRHRLSDLLDQPAKCLSRPVSPAGAVFVEMCEEYFQPILSELSHVLNQLSDHVCTQVSIYTHRAIWKLLLEIFRKSVTNLSKGTFDPRKRSFLLLNLFRFLLNIFASFGILQESELAEDQSTLQLLELYTLSTPKVVTMYESLEENDHPRTHYTMNPHLRKLCQQQKSFSGRQLLLHVSQLYVSLPEYKAKARAQQKCEQLIKQNIISLLFVREVNNCRLPDLVDDTLSSRYGSSTSSAREGASSPASSSGEFTSPLESDSDGGQNVTDPTQFYPDDEHFYAAVLTLSDVPFHHLNELDSDGIDTNHMRCILESRAKHDWEAREFLKQRGHYRRWFQGCLCISL